MRWRRGPASAAAILFALALQMLAIDTAAAADLAAPSLREWNFRVLLDDKPIGEHRFSVRTNGDEREVQSDASFSVKFLGFTAYHYRHQALERWRGGCLVALASTTDDDGKDLSVRLERRGNLRAVDESAAAHPLDRCVMSFAYWNPAIQTQTQLLNAQSGKLEPVVIQSIGEGSIDVHGTPVAARGFRIAGAAQPIDVWYSAEGEWIGLDSVVAGKRKLSYRIP